MEDNHGGNHGFWALRKCFLPPIPELDEAANLLSDAADALLAGNRHRASELVRQADMPSLKSYASSIMGKESLAVHRFRLVEAPSNAVKVRERHPVASTKKSIYARDGYRCRFCDVRVVLPEARSSIMKALPGVIAWSGVPAIALHAGFHALSATVDHIVPHAYGGDNDQRNLVTTCWPCNFGRMAYRLEEVGLIDPRTRPPIVDAWDGIGRLLRVKWAAR